MRDFTAIETWLHRQHDELERRVNAVERDARHSAEALDDDFAEQAVQRQNDEVLDALGNAGISELEQTKMALQRLVDNNFGVCACCGVEIPMGRLEAVPYADRCIDCAELDG